MRYISTRGRAPALSFEEVTLAGLASDGGLYVPESWPQLSVETLRSLRTASYVETAVAVMAPFVGDALSEDELRDLFAEASGRRSEERRGGKECVRTCKTRWVAVH